MEGIVRVKGFGPGFQGHRMPGLMIRKMIDSWYRSQPLKGLPALWGNEAPVFFIDPIIVGNAENV